MHTVCGYPVKSTWLKAVKAGNFVGWPLLTEKNISKYYPDTQETQQGHMAQTQKNVCSTKHKARVFEHTNIASLCGKKECDTYTAIYNVWKTIYSNQTGHFPMQSQQGNKYVMVMVMVEVDSNVILLKPIKIRHDHEMIQAYDTLTNPLLCTGMQMQPKKHVLDNEISANMKNHTHDKYKFTVKLVPPGCHHCNAAEVAIHNFKAHFLSVLAGTAASFPINP